MINFSAPDLNVHPPRSPRVMLGGFVVLPRIIDKCRAMHAGTNGDYHYNCPLDQRFFNFVKVDAEAFSAQVKAGSSDAELLAWILENAGTPLDQMTIKAWSEVQTNRAPNNVTYRTKFNENHASVAPHREDISTSFDMLDLDDFVSYGGKA